MSKFHSTVTRRDFMKAVGFGAAGIGAAAAAAPVFHDMDEVLSSPDAAQEKNAWWIKERPYLDSTTEIDWAIMDRFEGGLYDNGFMPAPGQPFRQIETATYMERSAAQKERANACQTNNNVPGMSLRDKAIKTTGWLKPYVKEKGVYSVLGQQDKVASPEKRGLPPWVGTPEENARMMRTVCRHMGATSVGFGLVEDATTKKLIHHTSKDFGPNWRIVFKDVDKPAVEGEGKGEIVLPTSFKYAIVCTIRHQLYALRMSPSYLSDGIVGKAYDQMDITQYRIKAFLQSIGYYGAGAGTWGMTMRPAWGVLTGLGELGRIHEIVTPQWGPMIRTTMVVFTDLPLPPSNPIDAGINRFCRSCTKCADVCPGTAIPFNTEPDYVMTDVNDPAMNPDHLQPQFFNNAPGYKRWPLNHYACATYWQETDTYCGLCNAECVFNKERLSSIHEFVKPVIANTSILNGFFVNMDVAYGYGVKPEEEWEEWWDKDHDLYCMGEMNY